MAFTANSDLNVLQASDSANVGAGAGNDVYVLTNGLLSDNQQVQIIDSGDNTIRLTSGLEIASSKVISNGFVLTLTNGAEITILESSGYTFEVGGDALTGQGATVQNFTQFVTQTLGLSEVPAVGDIVNGGALTVGGDVTAEPDNVFVLTEMPESSRLIDGLDLSNVQDYSGFDASLIINEKLAPVLTTDQKNDGVVGDGLANEGNDLILTDAYGLHGAVVNAGAGENELRIDMKGPFAQPTLLQNIQTVKVTNLENAYDGTRDAWMNIDDAGSADSTLDLSRAIDIENLIVNEGTAPGGSLTVWNIQNGAAVTLEGNFSEEVTLDFAGGLNAVNLTLDNVRDNGGNDFDLKLAHNAGQVNLVSEGRLNVVDVSEFGADLDTLNISGNAKLVLQADLEFRDDLAITVDASLSTGGVDLEVDLAANETGVVNLMGGSGNDSFEIKGDAAVGASDTNAITLTADMGTGSNDTLILNSDNTATTLRVLDGSSIDGNNVTLRVKNDADISEANDLFATDAGVTVEIDNGQTIILNQAQYDTIGTANFEVASVSANANGTIALQVADNFDVDTIDAAGLADGLTLGLNIADGVVLDITGDQLVNLVTNGVTFDGEGTLNVTGLTQANVTALEDWADEEGAALNFTGQPAGTPGVIITNGSATTVNMTLAEDVAFTDNNGTGATNLGAVAFELDGNTLTLKASAQADGLTVNNGEINLEFIGTAGVSLDMGDYTNITNITVWDALVNNNPNIENLFSDLSTSLNVPADQLLENIINIIATPADQLTPDRIVVIHEDVTRDGDLVFVTEDAATNNDNVQNVTVSLEGGSTLDGDIVLDRNTTKDGSLQTLTINSNGSDANTITGDIVADDDASGHGGGTAQNGVNVANVGENNLLDVTINAASDLVIEGTVVFSSRNADDDDATATLTLEGTGDITIDALDVSDTDVDTLNIINNAGTVNVPGASPAISMAAGAENSSIVISGTGTAINFGTSDDSATVAVDESNSGINADDLESIDASGFTGDVNLGIITGTVSNGDTLTITGSQGTTTLVLGEANDDNSQDLTAENSFAMQSQATVEITATSVTLANFSAPNMNAEAEADAGALSITATTLIIEGGVDLTGLVDAADNNKLDLSGVTDIQVAEGALVSMTDEQWDGLTAAQQAAFAGDGLVLDLTDTDTQAALIEAGVATGGATWDAVTAVDLTNVRGLTEVILPESFDADTDSSTLALTAAQAAVAYTVDTTDNNSRSLDADDVQRPAGDLAELATTDITVDVYADADLSAVTSIDTIRVIEDSNADVTLFVDQTDAFLAGSDAEDLDNMVNSATLTFAQPEPDDSEDFVPSNITIDVSLDTDGTPLQADGTTTATDITELDYEVTGTAFSIASAIADTANFGTDILNNATKVEHTDAGSAASASVTLNATAAEDTFSFKDSADFTGAVTIASFTAGTDILNLDEDVVTDDVTGIETFVTLDTNINTATAVLIVDSVDAATVDDVEDLFDGTTESFAFANANDTLYLVSDDGTDTYIFELDDVDGDGTIATGDGASEITLIATLTGIADATTLTADSFADFS